MNIREVLKKNGLILSVYDFCRQTSLKIQILISPRSFIERKWRKKFGYDIDLDNPKSFNEKLNWLKIYWKDPFITKCIDKYLVRDYVEKTIGGGCPKTSE